MATKVLVPLLGEGVEEVTVTKWLKREGDSIKELEPLLEVNTDKVDTEIPAPASGIVLKIVAQEGAPARVGEVLALIGRPGETMEIASPSDMRPLPPPDAARQTASGVLPQSPLPAREAGFISPVVARMALEHGIDLARRTRHRPEWPHHQERYPRVRAHRAIDGRPLRLRLRRPRATTRRRRSIDHAHHDAPADSRPHGIVTEDLPHVLTVMEADLGRVVAHRAATKPAFEKQGVKLTFTAYFIAAIAAALKAHPMANSSWTEQGVQMHEAINIGMATSLGDDGLIVPVIKGADRLSLQAIARSVNDLAGRARARKLQPDEVHGGTFTLTNHGIGGSLFAMPIINQPQCAILGTGAIQKRVLAVTDAAGRDAFAVRPVVYLSLVFDHRILDGASADAFLMKVKQTLEGWV